MGRKFAVAGGIVVDVPEVDEGPKRRLVSRPHSKDGNLSLYEFLHGIFESNETVHEDKPGFMPLTDKQIEAIVREQFAAYQTVIDSIDNNRSRVAVWRSVYNRGKMGPVKYCSFRRGGKHHHPVDNQTGLTTLSQEEKKEIASRYGIDDCRFNA